MKFRLLFFMLLITILILFLLFNIVGCNLNNSSTIINNNLNLNNNNLTNNNNNNIVTPGNHTINITVDGFPRTFILHLPTSFEANNTYPLLIGLQGFNETISYFQDVTAFSNIADAENFIVAYPVNTLYQWAIGMGTYPDLQGINDVNFVMEVINYISSIATINQKNIYICGYSGGGILAYLVTMGHADKICAIASVSGNLPEYIETLSPNDNLSVIIMQGTDDPYMLYDGGLISGLTGQIISTEATVNYWVTVNQADTTPIITNLPDIAPTDGCTVSSYAYENGNKDTEVVFYKITGGEHEWPTKQIGSNHKCKEIEAGQIIWDFFKTKTKQ